MLLVFLKNWLLPPSVYLLVRRVLNKRSVAAGGMDGLLAKWLDKDNGFFVELGANDGYFQSNTWTLERKRNWRGVLIEPSLNNFLTCIDNRSARNHFECCACVPFGFDKPMLELTYSNLMTVAETSVLDQEGHAKAGLQNKLSIGYAAEKNAELIRFGAVARTLTEVLERASAPQEIDFLSLDVEGGELSVLKGLDFEKYRFNFMLIECWKLAEIQSYLAGFGYEVVDKLSKHDYLFAPAGRHPAMNV
ncbi:methyltransferase, FkbM family [Roseibium suaedae]|uniref:Methyltransferase, FkbM family n=2 Tax=Roseibium suaedae TaxID=735517 RepID=A0A1M7EXW4_9HYPH|nr:methyltransferase, FkbM family [Roseibium suaedae]